MLERFRVDVPSSVKQIEQTAEKWKNENGYDPGKLVDRVFFLGDQVDRDDDAEDIENRRDELKARNIGDQHEEKQNLKKQEKKDESRTAQKQSEKTFHKSITILDEHVFTII